MKEPLLSLENISLTFEPLIPKEKGLTILNEISLEIYKGESLSITGASGEGKSSLLHIAGGLEKVTSGSQKWKNKPSLPPKDLIGFIFQQFHLLDDLSVWDNIMLPFRLKHRFLSEKQIEKAHNILRRVGLEERKNHLACLLSGGEKQRCAIARALVTSPDLILADEPTGNLDHLTASDISSLLFEMVKEENISLILVTHDLSLALRCDRALKLENGKLFEIMKNKI